MTRDELLDLRRKLFSAFADRQKLGNFDANSEAITLCLSALVMLVGNEIDKKLKIN